MKWFENGKEIVDSLKIVNLSRYDSIYNRYPMIDIIINNNSNNALEKTKLILLLIYAFIIIRIKKKNNRYHSVKLLLNLW